MSELRHPADTPLARRVSVFSESFPLDDIESMYVRRGSGPGVCANHRIPQRGSCVGSRLLSGSYVWNRVDAHRSTRLQWPVPATERLVAVELRGETLCVRMRRIQFFEPSLRLSTIVNMQVQWCAFDSPFISCISGHGIVAFRVDGSPEIVSREPGTPETGHSPPCLSLSRLVAWSRESMLHTIAKGDLFNAVTFASCAVEVVRSPLVIGLRADGEADGDGRLLSRILRLVVP